jgi:hypothetical protein
MAALGVLIRASHLGAGRTVETQLLDLLLLGELRFPPRLGAGGPDVPQRVVELALELLVLGEAVLGTATFDHDVLQPVWRITAAFLGRVHSKSWYCSARFAGDLRQCCKKPTTWATSDMRVAIAPKLI